MELLKARNLLYLVLLCGESDLERLPEVSSKLNHSVIL